MATAIRLRRGGRTHAPYYRVIVIDSRNRSRGRVIDQIGVYHPCARPNPLTEIDARKALDWLGKGAQPSATVRNIFSKAGIMAAFASGKAPEDVAAEPVKLTAPEVVQPAAKPAPVQAEAAEVSVETPSEAPAEEAPEAEA